MGKKIVEAMGIAPVPLNTISDAGVALRRLYPLLKAQAEVIKPTSISGVLYLADTQERRELERPKSVAVTTPLPEISRFRDLVMLGALSSADGQWIHAPFFLNQDVYPPQVIFGKDLTNHGRPGEFYVTDSVEKIVYHRPSKRLEDPDLVTSNPPVGLLINYPEVHSLINGILDFEIAA